MRNRVAYVVGSLTCGGVQNHLLKLIRRLNERNFDQLVLYQRAEPAELHDEFARVARIRLCPYVKGRPLQYIRRLVTLLREEAPRNVLSFCFGNHLLVSVAARMAKVERIYVSVVGDPVAITHSRWRACWLAHLARPFCDGEIAVSESVARTLVAEVRLPACRVRVIHNGCDVEEIRERAEAARHLRTPGATRRVLMVARLHRPKDHETLLKAASMLISKGRPVELLLAGDGPERTRLETLARQLGLAAFTRFLGTRHDIPELLGASDAMVLAAQSEGFALAVLEAMAAGTPVVATDIPPCREALGNGECGLLVPSRDPLALAVAIEKLFEDETYRRRLTEAAYQRVRELYDNELMAARYAQLLEGTEHAP